MFILTVLLHTYETEWIAFTLFLPCSSANISYWDDFESTIWLKTPKSMQWARCTSAIRKLLRQPPFCQKEWYTCKTNYTVIKPGDHLQEKSCSLGFSLVLFTLCGLNSFWSCPVWGTWCGIRLYRFILYSINFQMKLTRISDETMECKKRKKTKWPSYNSRMRVWTFLLHMWQCYSRNCQYDFSFVTCKRPGKTPRLQRVNCYAVTITVSDQTI